jgi:hypothetical protein
MTCLPTTGRTRRRSRGYRAGPARRVETGAQDGRLASVPCLLPVHWALSGQASRRAATAAAAGVEERVIAQQTGHRSMAVLRRYIRHGELFRQNAAALVGL